MATTNRKRSTSAKSTAKPAETQTDQPSVEEPKATPQSAAESKTGESAATPIDAPNPDSPSSPSSPVTPVESAAPGDSQEAASSAPATVTGDGSGEALPPIDPDAGERTAAGVNDEDQEEITALFIRTRKTILKRRRCGHVFTPEGHGIALAALSADQIAAFESDPTLIVEECTVPAQSADNDEDAQ